MSLSTLIYSGIIPVQFKIHLTLTLTEGGL